MLNLLEDKALLSQLISNYLKENNIQQWKFETLMRRLLDQELEIEPTDENLLEIGNLYKTEIMQYSNDHRSQLTQAEKKKIVALDDSISVICVAKKIKSMVKEAIFSSNYIQQLKDHALSSAIQSQQQKEQQQNEQQQQERHPFNSFSSNEKMIAIAEKFGTKGYLDLMTDKVSRRSTKLMQSIKKDLSLNLQLKATSQERDMLIKISRCNCAADVEALLQEFFSMRQLAPNSKFIRLALASAQTLWESKQLSKGSHNEDWYRLHVYSYIFDKAFINDEEFETKRSECYSNITKFFPNEPDQRIDFILRNLNDDSDLISTEEKPGRKGVKSDLEKGKAIQRMMLKKWLKEIGSIKLLNKLEAITCQWEGTKLTIFATRTLTPDCTVTYSKGKFSMPKSCNHLAEFSKLLLAVLSLRRLVLSNYKKMNLIVKEKQREELLLLDFEDDDSLCLRSDSTYDPVDDVGDDDNCKMDGDLEAELLKQIEEMDDDEDLKSCSNWEEFMVEKVARKKRKLNEDQ